MTLVIAHRGNSSVAPENTLPALAAAGFAGADMIEIDVHATSDGAGMIIHDDDVDRTTDAAGPVNALTWQDARHLDAGSWKDPAFSGAAVPMLSDVLALLERFEAMGLLLEFKGTWDATDAHHACAAIDGSAAADRTIVQSFDVETVRVLREVAPHLPAGLLVERVAEESLELAKTLGVIAYNPHVQNYVQRPELVTQVHDRGLRTYPWTSDEPQQWRALAEAGVDGIITNRPDRLAGYLLAKES